MMDNTLIMGFNIIIIIIIIITTRLRLKRQVIGAVPVIKIVHLIFSFDRSLKKFELFFYEYDGLRLLLNADSHICYDIRFEAQKYLFASQLFPLATALDICIFIMWIFFKDLCHIFYRNPSAMIKCRIRPIVIV